MYVGNKLIFSKIFYCAATIFLHFKGDFQNGLLIIIAFKQKLLYFIYELFFFR